MVEYTKIAMLRHTLKRAREAAGAGEDDRLAELVAEIDDLLDESTLRAIDTFNRKLPGTVGSDALRFAAARLDHLEAYTVILEAEKKLLEEDLLKKEEALINLAERYARDTTELKKQLMEKYDGDQEGDEEEGQGRDGHGDGSPSGVHPGDEQPDRQR